MCRLAGAEGRILDCSYENHYLLRPEQLEAAITPRTRMLVLNSPCNPTGAVFAPEELRALADVLVRHPHVFVVSDDIYEHILYDGREFANILMVAPELRERVFLVNGVSKAYSMTGWRIGFGAGPAEVIRNMEKIQTQSTSNPSSISQAGAVAALTGDQTCVSEMRAAFAERRDLVTRMLQSMPGVRVRAPRGAFYIFPDLEEVYKLSRFQTLMQEKQDTSPSRVFCQQLLDHYDVATVPGVAFGNDGALRISYALDESSLRQGLERLGNMIDDLR